MSTLIEKTAMLRTELGYTNKSDMPMVEFVSLVEMDLGLEAGGLSLVQRVNQCCAAVGLSGGTSTAAPVPMVMAQPEVPMGVVVEAYVVPPVPEERADPGVLVWLRFNDEERANNQLRSLPTHAPASPAPGFGQPTWDVVDGRTCMRFDNQRLIVASALPGGNAPYTIELTFKRRAGNYCRYGWMVPLFYGNEGQGGAISGLGLHQQNDQVRGTYTPGFPARLNASPIRE